MHVVVRREEIEPAAALPGRASGHACAPLLGGHTGTTHTGLALHELVDGHVDAHLHSCETTFYVLEGEPALYLDGFAVRLQPGACGAIPVGATHAWRADGEARWVEMTSPRPRDPGRPPDTFFVGPAPDDEPVPLDLRDPRNRTLLLLGASYRFERDWDSLVVRPGVETGAAEAPT